MMKIAQSLSIIVAVLLLHENLFSQTPSAPSTEGTSTVSGRVLLKGEPARSVAVTLIRQQMRGMLDQSPNSTMRARTDESGVFRFSSVARGQYQIRAIAPGFVSSDYSDIGGASRQLNVGDGDTIENLEFTLKIGGVITGQVTDPNGNPAVEEYITLTRIDSSGKPIPNQYYGGNPERQSTDDRGVYRLYGLAEGKYLVSAGFTAKEGAFPGPFRSNFSQHYSPGVTEESQATRIEVTEGFVTENIDIALKKPKKTYEILGRLIHGDTGQPLAGVDVAYGLTSTNGPGIRFMGGSMAQSGANGEFRLTGVESGQYGVFAYPASGDFYGEPTMCEVTDGSIEGVEVRAFPAGSISGVISIEGTRDPAVLAKVKQLQLFYRVRESQNFQLRRQPPKINPDGSFQIKGVPPGKILLSAQTMNGWGELNFRRVEFNGTPARDGIPLQKGESVTGVRVIMAYGAITLRGSIQVVGGSAPSYGRVNVIARLADQPELGFPFYAQVDQRGQFTMEHMPPGDYELQVTASSMPDEPQPNPQWMRAFAAVRQRVSIAGDNPPPVTIVIDLSKQEGAR